MRAFPRLSDLYSAWKTLVEKAGQGSVRIINEREVTRVERFSCKKTGGVTVWSRPTKGTNNEQSVVDPGEEIEETFDELVICTDADAALVLLGKDARWLEKRVLGNVKVGKFHSPSLPHADAIIIVSLGHHGDAQRY